MSGNSTYITDPNDGGEPKMFTFDYSYWSHDGFTEEQNGYLSPKSDQYADQVGRLKSLTLVKADY